MILLGLTGSIGMGKSTTAAMFAAAGAAVYDADAAVHGLYAAGGEAGPRLMSLFPEAVGNDGAVDRAVLSRRVKADPVALATLEQIVHPLVAAERAGFLDAASTSGARVAVLDVPLLFETGLERSVDAVVVVTAEAQVQRARVLARPGMDADKLALLLARQTPDADKRSRASFIIDTGHGLAAARARVEAIMAEVLQPGWKPT
ncbi:dephospho-CoA kinase [Caulobacter sp. S45]|uniref:dephospho-CoA kinase n=1 Tax=Caulobacter sp. S45 TaxID=1641861 RepID=UPI0015765ACE|nr:dephospho-CoA kinase [Caulobacter sp. S45]